MGTRRSPAQQGSAAACIHLCSKAFIKCPSNCFSPAWQSPDGTDNGHLRGPSTLPAFLNTCKTLSSMALRSRKHRMQPHFQHQ